MISSVSDLKSKFVSSLSSFFFNSSLPASIKAGNNLVTMKDQEIDGLVSDLFLAYTNFTNSCKAKDVKVTGGTGAPGLFSGGIGVGGTLDYIFNLSIIDKFNYDMYKKRNRIYETEINKAMKAILDSIKFKALSFSGTSTHTATSPGVPNLKSKEDTAKNVMSFSISLLTVSSNIQNALNANGFNVISYLKDDIDALEKTVIYAFTNWTENTKVSNIKCTSGVTTINVGTLSNGIGKYGTFN